MFSNLATIHSALFEPQPNKKRGYAEAQQNDKHTRQHNLKHRSDHCALFLSRYVAFFSLVFWTSFAVEINCTPIFRQLVAVHRGNSHAVIPIVAFIFSAHTAIIAWIICKINHFSFPYDSLNLRQANKHCAMPSIYPSALS